MTLAEAPVAANDHRTDDSILCYLIYAQVESVVPQYFLMLDADRAVSLVIMILVINAITLLASQMYLVRLLANISREQCIIIGSLVFAASQMFFLFKRTTSALWWGGFAFIFRIGEAILLPNFSLLLEVFYLIV